MVSQFKFALLTGSLPDHPPLPRISPTSCTTVQKPPCDKSPWTSCCRCTLKRTRPVFQQELFAVLLRKNSRRSTCPWRPTVEPTLPWCCLLPWARAFSMMTKILRRRGQESIRKWYLTRWPRMKMHPEDILTCYFIEVFRNWSSRVTCASRKYIYNLL